MTERRTPDMLVVLDSDPNSLAPLTIAQRYANGTVLLTSWNADPLEIEAVVQATASAEPTISEALEAAARRGMPWVGIRRDFAPPERLLSDLLIATAHHSGDVVPGFAVFLADGEPAPFRRILAIVDRSDGPLSGLLAYAAVAVADTAGAQLDILVIGSPGENLHPEDELETLVINREQELYDAAVERARSQELSVTWITAASRDLWEVVSAQLSQHDYDLVIDDLGDVSLARVGLRNTVDGTLTDGAAGEIPLKLLTHTTVPLLLVMDEIRLGLAPPGMLKAGAMAALALGMVATPIAATASETVPATVTSQDPDPVMELITDLESALGIAAEEAAEADRVQEAAEAGRGDDDGARAEAAAEAEAPAEAVEETQTTTYAEQSTVEASGTQAVATTSEGSPPKDEVTPEPEPEPKPEPEASKPTKPKAPKPPKGGATPSQVSKAKTQSAEAKRQAAKAKAAYEKDKAKQAKARQAVAEVEAALLEAHEAAQAALVALEAATTSHAEAVELAAAAQSAATGLTSLLPGSPTAEEVAAAAMAEQVAADSLAAAVASGEQALAAIQAADEALADQAAALEERAAAAEAAKADYEQAKSDYQVSKEKAAVYKASLAATRQSPVAKGSYRLTARFGQTGGYWSSGVHTGLDFAGSTGTVIMAAASGKVVSTGYAGAYGNQVIIDHGNGFQTTYNHLSGIGVSVGSKVTTGDKIARLGSTGNSTGPHLHFEVTKNGKFIDPEGWLGW